jgi:crotonobetainyl-CoA:carnitine CoA-transferase CaiB-like acyl-CoA transferase
MPLSAYRVVEIGTGSALAYCGKIFADFGAEVIKLEPAGGDPGRAEPPLVDVGQGRQESAYFAWLNTNKHSVIGEDAADLLPGADVLLDGRPNMASEHAALRTANPRLVVIALSWFGESGPYRDFIATDVVCRALAGMVQVIGPKERPLAIVDHQADIFAGLCSFIAAMTGLLSRGADGWRFAVSIHEANVIPSESHTAQGPRGPRGRWGLNRFPGTFPIGVYLCREGWLGVGISTGQQWRSFCAMLGMPEAASNPHYTVGPERAQHADTIEAMFAHRLRERTAAEWFAEALRRKLPFAIVPEMADLLTQQVHRANGAFVPVSIGQAKFEAPLMPLRLTKTPPKRGGVAPLAGESSDLHDRTPDVQADSAAGNLPLAGLRIVDFTMGWAGPIVTRQLADLGAEVIKIEACQHYDWWRGSDHRPAVYQQRLYEQRPNFLVLNRNKLGITLDLTRPEGVTLAKRLVAGADAVVENFSREVMPKLGLDYPKLRAVKPDLVMVSMAAFPEGDWATGRAYGFTLEQASGLPTVVGYPDGPPALSHFAYGDPIGGLNATSALLIGLLHRRRTGEGQHIDISQVECMLPMVAPWLIEQSATGSLQPRNGNRHPGHVPHGCFRCAGDDAWLFIAVTDDAMWQRLCTAIGRADLAKLATAAERRTQEDMLEVAIEAWTREQDADTAMLLLQAAGVAAGVARSPYDLASDPHLTARGYWQTVDRLYCGPHVQPSLPFRSDDRPYAVRHAAPTLGEHNSVVLRELLGLSVDELARLEADGIIGTEAQPPAVR